MTANLFSRNLQAFPCSINILLDEIDIYLTFLLDFNHLRLPITQYP